MADLVRPAREDLVCSVTLSTEGVVPDLIVLCQRYSDIDTEPNSAPAADPVLGRWQTTSLTPTPRCF